jgi:hypothetical protein
VRLLEASGGHLSAVIDFAGLGAGDPACDLVIAWNLFSPQTRPVLRAALQADGATWTRAQGWALTTGLNAFTSYAATSPLGRRGQRAGMFRSGPIREARPASHGRADGQMILPRGPGLLECPAHQVLRRLPGEFETPGPLRLHDDKFPR